MRLVRPFEHRFSRRNFIRLTATAAAGAAVASVLGASPVLRRPGRVLADTAVDPKIIELAATDGFIYLPGTVPNTASQFDTFLPDSLAEPPFTMWGFGFRDVTGYSQSMLAQQRGKWQSPAPMLYADEGQDVEIVLHNLGMVIRPDLTDGHTIHWHGFRDAIPLFDGVPELSIAVPIFRDFTYFYRPRHPGTYMYHCHFEDTEHVSMGMTGIVFVRPAQNQGNGAGILQARSAGNADTSAPLGYAYNDGFPTSDDDHSTRYDREYGMFLHEQWAQEHWEGAHILEHDWSDFEPDLWELNGRCWPDTIAPNGGTHDLTTGDLIAPPGRPDLQYNPISSLVTANAGDRVLLRFVNLGFQQHEMTVDAIPMRVVGKDATLLANGRTDLSYETYGVYIGPGESVDALFEAPAYQGGGSAPDVYRLYNRNLSYLHNPGLSGLGGQMTEIRVYPTGTLAPQTVPQEHVEP